MTPGRDDDALTWDGDDDPTLDLGDSADTPDSAEAGRRDVPDPDATPDAAAANATPARLPQGFTAVGKGSDTVGSELPAAAASDDSASDAAAAHRAAESAPMGNGTLVALGVLGGIYALYAVGWLIGGLRLQGRAQYLVLDVMYQGSLWLAVLAPLLWFATTLLLTRRARPWLRFAWLAAGAVLLLPWPFVMIGAVGQ
ncbi:DNA polymerase III subunit gamma/tau [Microbacterium sp. M3]|uniref:DNA polymerase III subunit gamma/tau n=1 Tax=Microbacterium arthrosphaerae TaxID=792652 RepID=A0ABU4H0T9_9MICO|nr:MULTISPECIES: DNA polymerase III subunit gamma/tau [Microbacterium]MDW4572923.1 DNA polymerase III subunit gamma/tau [Microbacterium arthrosphaerae]MDW7606778.1 DNA polymerase III subunit gamma/tau [Microbacterium sp. M3]